MGAKFSFAVDRPRGLIRIVMSGLFAADDIARFLGERRRAHAELGCAPNRHSTLNDLRAMKIQPQQSVAAFGDLLADPEYRSRRLAFVVSRTLAHSQLMRALGGRQVRCFADPEEAEAWLLAGDAGEADEPETAAEARAAALRAFINRG